jgi:hypothetical protein
VTWLRLEDDFADHPKIRDLDEYALAVHVWALCDCARHLTDGFVAAASLMRCPYAHTRVARSRALAKLTRSGLWEVEDGGYRIHDYLEYNPDRASVLEKRRLSAERQQRWRDNKEKRSNASRNASTRDRVTRTPNPAPKGAGSREPARRPEGRALIVNKCPVCGKDFDGDEDIVFCSPDCEAQATL